MNVENLKAAFAVESQSAMRYLAYAEKADEEGYTALASLFRSMAQSETTHALGHFRSLGGVGTTAENLQTAYDDESYETAEIYPRFAAIARQEGDEATARWFEEAGTVESRLKANLAAALERHFPVEEKAS